MSNINIITAEQADSMWGDERNYEWVGYREINGREYSVLKNRRTKEEFAAPHTRSVHMGFNSNEPGKVEEFIAIVEREGACHASWGVTGRTMHLILANQLAASLPQYDWEIGYNYHCKATKKE